MTPPQQRQLSVVLQRAMLQRSHDIVQRNMLVRRSFLPPFPEQATEILANIDEPGRALLVDTGQKIVESVDPTRPLDEEQVAALRAEVAGLQRLIENLPDTVAADVVASFVAAQEASEDEPSTHPDEPPSVSATDARNLVAVGVLLIAFVISGTVMRIGQQRRDNAVVLMALLAFLDAAYRAYKDLR